MESYLFWDSETQVCVVVCEDVDAPVSLALAAVAEDRRQVIATDGGASAGRRILIGALPPACAEAALLDLDRPDERLASFRLAGPGTLPDKRWTAAFFAPKSNGAEYELTLLDIPGDHSRDSLLHMVDNAIQRRSITGRGCWMAAAPAATVGQAVEPAALVFPPVPTLTVEPVVDAPEETSRRGPWATDLLEQAFKPQTGVPRLTLRAAEAQQIAGAGPIVVVTMAHQILFFTAKDRHLRNVGLPAVNSLSPEAMFADADLRSSATHLVRVDWEAGKSFRDRTQLRKAVVEIAADGRNGLIRYNEAAVGDDLYLVAQQPLFLTPERETLTKAIGFRVGLHGFTLLDAAAPGVAPLFAEAERLAARALRQSLDLDHFSAVSRTERPSPGRPLEGLLRIAYDRTKRAGAPPSFAEFEAAPALHGELAAWSARPIAHPAPKATLAHTLAAAADVATALAEQASLAEQAQVIRALRDGERMKRLREARIELPLGAAETERALQAAKVLADDDLVEEAEEIAFERGDFNAEGALRKFRERGPSEWTALAAAERLTQIINDFVGEEIVGEAKLRPNDPEARSRRLDEECKSFEEQLRAARALAEASEELDRIEADYRARKANAKLDTRRTLPRLRKRLSALTTGPAIESNFRRAVAQLEAWATLPDFSAALLGADAGAFSLERWDAIVGRLKPPPAEAAAEPGWRAVRKSLADSIAQDWRRLCQTLQSDEIERRAGLMQHYAQALLHHRAYMALAPFALRPGESGRLANALRSWPQDAGYAWRVAGEELDPAALKAIAEPPRLERATPP